MKAKGWSNPKTSETVFRLLDAELDWKTARVADVGAGRGALSYRLSEFLRDEQQLEPREHVFPCDLIPASFEVETLECRQTGADGRLPFEDAHFDATISIEVIEHVEDQFAFLRELVRITKPGGLIVVTTPNTLQMGSRLRTLATGFPTLFDPLPLAVRAHPPDLALFPGLHGAARGDGRAAAGARSAQEFGERARAADRSRVDRRRRLAAPAPRAQAARAPAREPRVAGADLELEPAHRAHGDPLRATPRRSTE